MSKPRQYRINVGSTVEIIAGPNKGLTGEVQRIDSKSATVRMLLIDGPYTREFYLPLIRLAQR